jgi:hypothetical protein
MRALTYLVAQLLDLRSQRIDRLFEFGVVRRHGCLGDRCYLRSFGANGELLLLAGR